MMKLIFQYRCEDKNCKWYIRARNIGNTEKFRIIGYEKNHTCSADFKKSDNKHATVELIGDIIKGTLKDPTIKFRPIDIMNHMKMQYGITIDYFNKKLAT